MTLDAGQIALELAVTKAEYRRLLAALDAAPEGEAGAAFEASYDRFRDLLELERDLSVARSLALKYAGRRAAGSAARAAQAQVCATPNA